MNNRKFYEIKDDQSKTKPVVIARLVVDKLDAMEINLTELNNCCLHKKHDYFRS